MQITWHGHNCFLVKGSDATLLIDPFEGVDLGSKKIDIVVMTTDTEVPKGIEAKYKFSWPGEYEAMGTAISLYPIDKFANDILVLHFAMDGYNCSNLGFIKEPIDNTMSEYLGDIDVLMVPTGGNGKVLDPKKAAEVIETIDPKVVIPACIAAEKHGEEYLPVAGFVKEVGINMPSPAEKYKVPAKSSLPVEHTEFVVLELG